MTKPTLKQLQFHLREHSRQIKLCDKAIENAEDARWRAGRKMVENIAEIPNVEMLKLGSESATEFARIDAIMDALEAQKKFELTHGAYLKERIAEFKKGRGDADS